MESLLLHIQNITDQNIFIFESYDCEYKSGELRIEESLKEPMYDLSIKAVKLKKRVQMYQVKK